MQLTTIAVRNVARNKFRTVLTVMGTAFSVLTFLVLQSVTGAYTRGSKTASQERIVTRHKISYFQLMPKRYVDDVRAVPHVRTATAMSWFGASDPKHADEFFGSFMIDPTTYFDVYDGITLPNDQKEAFIADRQGAIIGETLATKLGWTIGQTVPLESGMYPAPADQPWAFKIDGIYTTKAKTDSKNTIFVHYDFVNTTLAPIRQNRIQFVASRIDDPSRATDVTQAIDRLFDERDDQTISQDERSYKRSRLGSVTAILKGLNVISFVMVVITMLILGNTVAMGVRERTKEYGVLRALGFLPHHVLMFVLGEGAVVGIVGGLAGVALAYPLITYLLAPMVESMMAAVIPSLRLTPPLMLTGLAIASGLGALAGAIPGTIASRIRPTEALRNVA